MSILVPEIASVYGALDSDGVFADGEVPSAHIARVLARSANRLLCRGGEPLLNMVWDSGGAVTETPNGGCQGYGSPSWIQITPGPLTRPKKPGITKAKLNVRAWTRTGESIFIQVGTLASPPVGHATGDSPNTVKIDGNGSWQWHSKSDIPIDYGHVEAIAVYLRGLVTSTAGATGTYGSPNSGTVDQFSTPTEMFDNGATWSLSPTWASGGHAVVFEDGSGRPLGPPQWIVGVIPTIDPTAGSGVPTYATGLRLYPGIQSEFTRTSIVGQTYRIFETARWRLANISLYPQDRTG